MYPASDPVSLYLTSLDKQLRLDPWTRRRVLAEIEDHLREAETSERECGPETFFGDHRRLARDLMLAWLERRYLSLKFLLIVAALVTALAMFAIRTLTSGGPLSDGNVGVAELVQVVERGAGLAALAAVGAALLSVRARTFELSKVWIFTRLAGAATLLLAISVAGEIVTTALWLPPAAAQQLLPIAVLQLAETISVSIAFRMWGLANRILAGLR